MSRPILATVGGAFAVLLAVGADRRAQTKRRFPTVLRGGLEGPNTFHLSQLERAFNDIRELSMMPVGNCEQELDNNATTIERGGFALAHIGALQTGGVNRINFQGKPIGLDDVASVVQEIIAGSTKELTGLCEIVEGHQPRAVPTAGVRRFK